jgi:hypothetical protein
MFLKRLNSVSKHRPLPAGSPPNKFLAAFAKMNGPSVAVYSLWI